MKNLNNKRKILSADEAKTFAAHIEKLENEIEAEEIHDDGDVDWRVRRVGDVGSDSWNAQMQEIDLELEKLQAKTAHKTKADEIQRMKQLAGIAKPHVEALAHRQVKKLTKKR